MIKIRVRSCWKSEKGPQEGTPYFIQGHADMNVTGKTTGGSQDVLKGEISSSPVLWHMLNVSWA